MKPNIGPDTKLCMSLAGRPGTFGSLFHNALYETLGLDYIYKAFSTTDLEGAIRGIRALSIRGCAISMPFKEAVIPLIDGLHGSAAAIESVNTIVNNEGVLTGYNSDYSAVRALIGDMALAKDAPFLLRGSGGMAKAVGAAFRDSGFTNGKIVARNRTKGQKLAAALGYQWTDRLDEADAALLINVTPIGMEGPDVSALSFPPALVERCQWVFEVVAKPVETPLLLMAQSLGKPVTTGAQVATLQALEQFVLYTGISPAPAQVEAAEKIARQSVSKQVRR